MQDRVPAFSLEEENIYKDTDKEADTDDTDECILYSNKQRQ